MPQAPSPTPKPAESRPSTRARLPFTQRLSTRMVVLQAAVVAGALVFTAWRAHNQKIDEARSALGQTGETLVPFMLPSIRPALDFAVDEATGSVDESLLQDHIVVAVFDTAK